MNIRIEQVTDDFLPQFKRDMQEAFQKGAEAEYGPIPQQILPESHINVSLNKPSCVPYMALQAGEMVGGAIVQIDNASQHNHLDFFYVKHGTQSKGIGLALWKHIERLHPETKIWETGTPYFEKRNIHFYVNKCKFHIVEFFNRQHPDSHDQNPDAEYAHEPGTPGFDDGFFRFEKHMKP